ncbi:MAG: hypothetical protein LBJ15_18110 [Comamonas sp.]|jgi:hypothetical protein|uniref:hypothetical protein n=1 Tax=Comamonas sp. TaxID=34028 RepID=UPI002827DEE4|nr:hypothetical protein [Comamonas sp.]MDR0215891.1 hypothetical protein [Comamonas sp.]
MLWLFDTGRMAKKFGKWRGAVAVAHAVAVCILAVMFSRLSDILILQDDPAVTASSVALMALVIYCVGVLLGLWGAYQLIVDATRGAYISAADHYDREGL